MASEQAQAVWRAYIERKTQLAGHEPTLEEQRASGELLAQAGPALPGVTYRSQDAGGVPAEWLFPADCDRDRVIFFLHGGGYVLGSIASHRRLLGHLAQAAGCGALSVGYRLAPEHRHPAAVNDAVTAYRWLLDSGVGPASIAFAGDSAGGGLAAATLLKARDEGLPMPAAAALLSPWTDLAMTGESATANAELDLIIPVVPPESTVTRFLGDGDRRDPYASPLYGDLSGLPPLYLQVGSHEMLLDDSTRFMQKAVSAGVDARLDIFPEMQHVHQHYVGNMPEADDAVARVGAFLRARMAGWGHGD